MVTECVETTLYIFMWYKKCFGKVLHFIYLRSRRGANDLRLSATVYTL